MKEGIMATEEKAQQVRLALCSMDSVLMQATVQYILACGAADKCVIYRRGEKLLEDLHRDAFAGFHGILLDAVMQDMNAGEFLLRLHTCPPAQRPAVLLMTTQEQLGRMSPRLQGELDGLVYKPLQPAILADRVRMFCAEQQRTPSDAARLLQSWGIQETQTKEKYFISAVEILQQAESHLALRKELFPVVAQWYGVSISAVDSGLRRMIDTLEKNEYPAYLRFKAQYGLQGRRPTVHSLLSSCVKALELCRGRKNQNGQETARRNDQSADSKHHQSRNGAAPEFISCQ